MVMTQRGTLIGGGTRTHLCSFLALLATACGADSDLSISRGPGTDTGGAASTDTGGVSGTDTGGSFAAATTTGGASASTYCHVDCFRESRTCRDGTVYVVHYGMPCGHGLSVCSTGLPERTCEHGCAADGMDCAPGDADAGNPSSSSCGQFDPTGKDCGTCTQSLDEYCASSECQLAASARVCQPYAFDSSWESGCGFLRLTWAGDVSDRGVKIWDQVTGRLVYLWNNGRLSMGCGPELRVGNHPDEAIEPYRDPVTRARAITTAEELVANNAAAPNAKIAKHRTACGCVFQQAVAAFGS